MDIFLYFMQSFYYLFHSVSILVEGVNKGGSLLLLKENHDSCTPIAESIFSKTFLRVS